MLPKAGRGVWSAYLILSVRTDPTLLCRSTFRDARALTCSFCSGFIAFVIGVPFGAFTRDTLSRRPGKPPHFFRIEGVRESICPLQHNFNHRA